MTAGPDRPDTRYALYFRPPDDDPLTRAADRWLGRSPVPDAPLPPPPGGIDPIVWKEWTAGPRGYGFHATLKPPFRLAPETDRHGLETAVAAFASARRSFELPGLTLRRIGRFLALGLEAPTGEMNKLADDCVRALDAFRAPPTAPELAKRRAAALNARQEEYLARSGYPYILEEFRFHMTLTGALDPSALDEAEEFLSGYLGNLPGRPIAVRDLCLFRQHEHGAPFSLARRVPFGSGERVNE